MMKPRRLEQHGADRDERGSDVKLRVIAGAALLAVAPLISFLVGGLYLGVLEGAFGVRCFREGDPGVCLPGTVLTLGGFMPAALIVTIPAAVLVLVGALVISVARKPRSPTPGAADRER
jgi:predicted acyltransferase